MTFGSDAILTERRSRVGENSLWSFHFVFSRSLGFDGEEIEDELFTWGLSGVERVVFLSKNIAFKNHGNRDIFGSKRSKINP